MRKGKKEVFCLVVVSFVPSLRELLRGDFPGDLMLFRGVSARGEAL